LPDLAQAPADAFEAFTSPTLGDTSLLDGRQACPGTCLIGGTNAMLWTRSVEEIIARLRQDLDALPHHRGLVITSAGVMPPLCPPERIRAVCEWVKSYPARW
jgi:uroporphyrinogen-III decarboxylase